MEADVAIDILTLLDDVLGTRSVPALDGGNAAGVPNGLRTTGRRRAHGNNRRHSLTSVSSRKRGRAPSITSEQQNDMPAPLLASALHLSAASGTTHARLDAQLQAHELDWARFKATTAARLGRLEEGLVISRSERWRDTQMASG